MKRSGIRLFFILVLMGIIFIIPFCTMPLKENTSTETPADDRIRLSDAQIQLANIKTAPVREGYVERKISLPGTLRVNEQSAVTVSCRVPGRIEKLYFRNTGEMVRKGDKLYDFYSDVLIDEEREYFRLQSNNYNFTGKYEPSLASENKLLIMGMLPEQIKQLGKDGKIVFVVTIYSPVGGKIRSVNVSEGQYITEGVPMFELADDRDLWVEAQVYPDEIRFLRNGMPVTITVPATGEPLIRSEISFINPSFETGTNVTLVRAQISNPNSMLHPGMFALTEVKIPLSGGVVIPSSALISSTGDDLVWIMEEEGVFLPRSVTTGLQSEDSVLILSGLYAEDQVVTSGAYLLNSEFILKQGTSAHADTGMPEDKPGI